MLPFWNNGMNLRGILSNVHRAGPHLRSRRLHLLFGVAVVSSVLAACSTGTYQVEVFPEQHYHQTYRRQEAPRLDPPPGAVPITGAEVALAPGDADAAQNPVPNDQAAIDHGAELYRVNCSMCHGPDGEGDGEVGAKLVRDGYARPPSLVTDTTQNRTDGGIFYVLSNGINVMPDFSPLLSAEERWTIVHYIRYLAQQS